jgi:hypothetical protein
MPVGRFIVSRVINKQKALMKNSMQPARTTSRKSRKQKRGNGELASAPCVWSQGGKASGVKYYYGSGSNQQLYHNVPSSYLNSPNLLDAIPWSTGASGKIGIRIFVKELVIDALLNNKAARPNVTYRFVVVAAPATASTDAYTELFNGGSFMSPHVPTSSILLFDRILPENQGTNQYLPTANATPLERSTTLRVTVPINRSVTYNESTGLCATRLMAYVIAYDAYGSLPTDNIATVATTGYRIAFYDDAA